MTQGITQGELRRKIWNNMPICECCSNAVNECAEDKPCDHCSYAIEFVEKELTKARLEGAANYVTTVYGERCEAKDTDEFPGIDEDPKATRCLICREWEYYDEWASSLTTQLKKGE